MEVATTSSGISSSLELVVEKLTNLTQSSLGRFVVVPSLVLVITVLFFIQTTMAFQQQQPARPASPPSLVNSRSSLSLASSSSGSGTRRLEVPPPDTKQIHLIILIHGWLGSPLEMGSIQNALESHIDKKLAAASAGTPTDSTEDEGVPPSMDHPDDSDSENIIPVSEEGEPIPEGTVVLTHSVQCNDGKTTDGITAGGQRVAQEVNQIIKELLGAAPITVADTSTEKKEEEGTTEATVTAPNAPGQTTTTTTTTTPNQSISDASVSLSFIGNSLGGLYARSALADVQWELPNGKTLVPNIFCTTCTPHLGKRGLTYLPLPRFAEQGIGYALQPTGQDLFGCNKVIEDLATQAQYVDPLKRFQKRIAYANAFGTDLQVPTSTAAFLADTESPHITQESNPPFLLKVTTPRDDSVLQSMLEATKVTEDNSRTHIPATTMARTLDAMGWTKVFCDVRDKLLLVPIPFQKGGEENSSEFTRKDEWTSHELKEVIASRIVHDKKWPVPWGHQMMIANSKSEFFAKLNQGGLPFVKQLATEFLEDVLLPAKCK